MTNLILSNLAYDSDINYIIGQVREHGGFEHCSCDTRILTDLCEDGFDDCIYKAREELIAIFNNWAFERYKNGEVPSIDFNEPDDYFNFCGNDYSSVVEIVAKSAHWNVDDEYIVTDYRGTSTISKYDIISWIKEDEEFMSVLLKKNVYELEGMVERNYRSRYPEEFEDEE